MQTYISFKALLIHKGTKYIFTPLKYLISIQICLNYFYCHVPVTRNQGYYASKSTFFEIV